MPKLHVEQQATYNDNEYVSKHDPAGPKSAR